MSSEGKSDSDLMAELREGRDFALSELIARWQKPLLAFAYRYTQQAEDAADIVQETFVRVYLHRRRYRPGARFSSWLFTIAANLCHNRARWRRRHPTVPLENSGGDFTGGGDGAWLADAEAEIPGQALSDQEKVAAVKQAIGELPHDLKTALLLFQYEELSYREIASVVGCSVKAVETRLYRARLQLKQKLGPHLLDESPAPEKRERCRR